MIIDDQFYLLTWETAQDLGVTIRTDASGARYVKAREARRVSKRMADSLGFEAASRPKIWDALYIQIVEGLQKEGVAIR